MLFQTLQDALAGRMTESQAQRFPHELEMMQAAKLQGQEDADNGVYKNLWEYGDELLSLCYQDGFGRRNED